MSITTEGTPGRHSLSLRGYGHSVKSRLDEWQARDAQQRLWNRDHTLWNAEPQPEITYPRLEDSITNKFYRAWGNSVISTFNFEDDHGDYQERVEQNKEHLEKEDLNELYEDTDLTGWE